MTDSDLDRLFGVLRRSAPHLPGDLCDTVMARLGPPVIQIRKILWAGAAACLVSVLLSAGITLSALVTAPGDLHSHPPELTLLTRGASPLSSL